MDYPMKLRQTLTTRDDNENRDTSSDGGVLRHCNDAVEGLLTSALTEHKDLELLDQEQQQEEDMETVLNEISSLLMDRIVSCIRVEPSSSSTDTSKDDDTADLNLVGETINVLRRQSSSELLLLCNDTKLLLLAQLLRATKNLMRWYMQIYLTRRPSPSATSSLLHAHPLQLLQKHDVLNLYWTLLQVVSTSTDTTTTTRLDVARQACLSLFYATYDPMMPSGASESRNQQAQQYLVESLGFLEGSMRLLLQLRFDPTSADDDSVVVPVVVLVLSLLRLVHNILASLQGAVEKVEEIRVTVRPGEATWVGQITDNETQKISMQQIVTGILLWSLDLSPQFPGLPEDRRTDLVMEILRVLYILKSGKDLDEAEEGARRRDSNSLSRAILYLLRASASKTDPRVYECKLAAISLLMDSSGSSFVEYLVQESVASSLVEVMQKQVDMVVDNSLHGTAATATLVPILSVVNRFCKANTDFLRLAKTSVFPPDSEQAYRALASQEISRTKGAGFGAKNMKPLDAPRDTLRGKLMRLMTWPESHTKRATTELVWTLCDGQPRDFVLRCGLGNALPVLSAKGLVELPSSVIT